MMKLTGKIVHGQGRGKQMKVPTINIEYGARPDLEFGVYAVWAELLGVRYKAVMNWGARPTFDESEPTMEVHLLDFDGDVYGEVVKLEILDRLRGVQKFSSKEELVLQIQKDIKQAEELFTLQ